MWIIRNTLIVLFLIMSTSLYSENLIDPPKEDDTENKTTKQEKGILADLVLMYTKVRNGVKYAYDEIQYWKNMKKTYTKMEKWFSRNKEKMNQIGNSISLLTTEKGDFLSKLRKTQKIFDQVEDVAFKETKEFDHILATFENNYDSLIAHERIKGRMLPNTNDILDKVSTLFSGESSKIIISDTMSENEKQVAKQRQKEENELSEKRKMIPETSIYEVSKLVASSSMSKSEVYYGWSLGALSGIEEIANKYKDYKGINQKEMQTAWYGIEQVNANNFRLRHSQEELKVYIGLLGLNTWKASERRGCEEFNQVLSEERSKELVLLRAKERREYKEKYGMERPSSN